MPLFLLMLLVAIALAVSPPAHAATSAMSIYPSRHAVTVAPGGRETLSVTVANTGDAPLRIRAYEADWTLDPVGALTFLPVGQGTHSAHRMVAVTPSQFVVPAGRSQQVRFQLAVPVGTLGGEYHDMIFFETSPVRGGQTRTGARMLFNQRIGVTLYVAVPPVRHEATVTGLQYLPPGHGQPARLALALQNLGNAHVRAYGKLRLALPDGHPVFEKTADDLVVLRESRRCFYLPLNGPLAPGRYHATVWLDYGGNETIEAETELRL